MADNDESPPAELTDSQPNEENPNANIVPAPVPAPDPYSYYKRRPEYDPEDFFEYYEDDKAPPPTPEQNVAEFKRFLSNRRWLKKQMEQEKDALHKEDRWNFPKDKENWEEKDLRELWADRPFGSTKQGWDPVWADERDWDIVREEVKQGWDPPIAPFYMPYRRTYPVIPDAEDYSVDIYDPYSIIEEFDRIEANLTWESYIFPDGSSYEGTVWDDLAHGKGVYIAELGLVRYEGEWLRNNMEGHGVVEVDIPDVAPLPGSQYEAQMRAKGKIITTDFLSPDDKKWLEMDIEDRIRLAGGSKELPFYENDIWVKQFGRKPEKGRYRYAGEWKHGKMHGCGVYDVNGRTIYGRFYFGEFVDEATDCDENISALHAGIAEVAAAKARMFVNKPDGMVREKKGPYGDPQHFYFYEEEDVWMAPGFINQFYEVPGYWKRYVHEVDQEREMWLNSFYKAPLRLPMPSELQYWWENEEEPEFVVLHKEPEPDPEDPSKLIETEDPVILHTPTGRIINYVEDEEHGIRLFWQPTADDDEDLDLDKVEYLPLGFDEFYGKVEVVVESKWLPLLTKLKKALEPILETFKKIEKWSEEKKKDGEMNIQLIEKELELAEAEWELEEALEAMEEDLEMEVKEKEEAEMGLQEEESVSESPTKDEKSLAEEEEEQEEDEDEDEEDGNAPSSFGSVVQDGDSSKTDQKGSDPGKSPFSTTSLSFASCSLITAVPSRLQQSLLVWKDRFRPKPTSSIQVEAPNGTSAMVSSVSFPPTLSQNRTLRSKNPANSRCQTRNQATAGNMSQMRVLSRILTHSSASRDEPKRRWNTPRMQDYMWLHAAPESDADSILSLHSHLHHLESYSNLSTCKPLSV